jgi:RNA polymerase sigma-70 factor, ECF subfamily
VVALESPLETAYLQAAGDIFNDLQEYSREHLFIQGGGTHLHQDPEVPDGTHTVASLSAPLQPERHVLLVFLEGHTASLLATIQWYVQELSHMTGEECRSLAFEVLQETVIESLAHAERFTPSRQPMAWLLGIAANVIKRKTADAIKRQQHEIPLSALSRRYPELPDEDDLLDQLTSFSKVSRPEQEVEADEQASAMLSLLSEEDQLVLRLALLEDVKAEALAQRLGTTIGTARMRLHRALRRLRAAWGEQLEGKQHE